MGKVDDEVIYLSAPEWSCGWYWGFGYLGNKNTHYHLDGLNRTENIHLRDAILKHFGESFTVTDENDVWTFTELVLTAYSLREAAEVLGRGGSHCTTNPVALTIKNEAETKRINEIVLPEVFSAIEDILKKYR